MVPKVLYHVTDPANRASIQMHGLSPDFDFTGYSAIFLAKTPLPLDADSDQWRVYTQGLDIEDDITTPGFEGEWFMLYGVIPPDRLELMEEWEKAARWKVSEFGDVGEEMYMGWPKFERGEGVTILGYGDKGTIDSARWSPRDEQWYYVVTVWDSEGMKDQAIWPESDLERRMLNLDQGAQLDQPSAWTLKDFGIPPEAEDYFRSAKVKHIPTGVSGEHGLSPNRIPWLWSSELQVLFVGDGGGTHSQFFSYLRDLGLTANGFDTLWDGMASTDSNVAVIFGHYDVNQFRGAEELDQAMLADLAVAFPFITDIGYRDVDNDLVWLPISARMSKMAANQQQLDAIRQTFEGDENARAATDALTAAGGKVYIVGGAVRDAFLGRKSKDVDLMCAGLTGEEITAALKPLGPVKLTGEAFGVYRFRLPHTDASQEVEIALPRTEQSTGAGHKDFEVKTDPYLDPTVDLQRRDFTGNAMAYDPIGNELLDPHGGADDLTAGRLRLVNDNALSDDPLRIVRALVANARFGLQPDDDLLDALQANAHKLKSLPGERIQMEMDKLLAGDDPANAMMIAAQTGLIDYMVPELSAAIGFDQMNPHHDLTVYDHTMEVLRAAARLSDDPDIRLAALFHDSGKPESFWRDETAPEGGGGHFYKKVLDDGTELGDDHEAVSARLVEAFMKRLRYPNDRIKRVTTLCANHMFPYFKTEKGARKFLAMLDGDFQLATDLLTLREADASGKKDNTVGERDRAAIDRAHDLLNQALENNTAVTVKDLAVNGHDLMQLGLKGPQIGQAQKKLLEMIIDNPELNNRESLLGLLRDGLLD